MMKYGKKLIIMSKQYLNYLKRNKKYKNLIIFSQLLIFVVFILIWQLLVNKNLINSFITSSPYKILLTIKKLFEEGELFSNIIVTIYEITISFLFSIIIGFIIASLMWFSKTFAKIIEPYLTIINSLPKVALGPIIIIWFGAGIKSIIIMSLLISTFITIINIYQGFINVDSIKLKLMKTFKANKIQIFTKLIIPSNVSNIVSTLKINISMSLIGIIMGEFLVSKEGIGYLIMYGSQVFNLNLVMSGILILCIISTIMYYFITYIEKNIIKNK